ncbi:arylamine N-acetyltransferase [Halorarum salinum]|uniref:Arylamine N-acetyltransferase n=2 Tax=Halorarum salinum TaxID=2743089 RepID=A0A7D5QEA6_9EURY|nr:arylamine N-acetyltransferase [Halobaculum salinum]
MDPDRYLERIGVDPDAVETPDLETLARLQRAHVTAVAFENLDVVGDPYGDREGSGVVLSVPDLYAKVVERGRGGFCFELNGLFHWLLAELGYDVDRVAARVTSDGDATPPANHHANVVQFDRRYVTDVGMGTPTMRRPLPLDGGSRADGAGVEWRVAESDRPDETYRTEYRTPGESEWSTRYVFSDVPRELSYFEATCDYLASAPESTFTGDPIVTVATDEGHLRLSRDTLTEIVGGDGRERTVTGEEWHEVLASKFGLRYDRA